MRHCLAVALLSLGGFLCRASAQDLKLPNAKESFHFAVIGDTGTGGSAQYKVAEQMARFRKVFPFDTVVMMGDNLYGGESARDFEKKFERPYEALLKGGVKFYATLGNHDNPNQRFYKNFHMEGNRFYSFRPDARVHFFSLDSNYLSEEQLEWLGKELGAPGPVWKIVFFHHPLYSSGETHGSSLSLRKVLEPLFIKAGVSLVLAGHEHFYERIKPQNGITYFVVGNSAKLRRGDLQASELTAKGSDTENGFLLCEIDSDTLHFQAISSTGATIDEGSILRRTK